MQSTRILDVKFCAATQGELQLKVLSFTSHLMLHIYHISKISWKIHIYANPNSFNILLPSPSLPFISIASIAIDFQIHVLPQYHNLYLSSFCISTVFVLCTFQFIFPQLPPAPAHFFYLYPFIFFFLLYHSRFSSPYSNLCTTKVTS